MSDPKKQISADGSFEECRTGLSAVKPVQKSIRLNPTEQSPTISQCSPGSTHRPAGAPRKLSVPKINQSGTRSAKNLTPLVPITEAQCRYCAKYTFRRGQLASDVCMLTHQMISLNQTKWRHANPVDHGSQAGGDPREVFIGRSNNGTLRRRSSPLP